MKIVRSYEWDRWATLGSERIRAALKDFLDDMANCSELTKEDQANLFVAILSSTCVMTVSSSMSTEDTKKYLNSCVDENEKLKAEHHG